LVVRVAVLLRSRRVLSLRGSEEVLTGASGSRGEKLDVVSLEVGMVAWRKWRSVAFAVGFAGSRLRVGPAAAGASVVVPGTLQIVVVTRREGCLVTLLVEATSVMMVRVVVSNAGARGRSAVSSVITARVTVVTFVARRVSAGFAITAHFRGRHAEPRLFSALVVRVAVLLRSRRVLSLRGSEEVLTGARGSRGEQLDVVSSQVVAVAPWAGSVTPLSGFTCAASLGPAVAFSIVPNALKVIVVTRGQGRSVASLVDVSGAVVMRRVVILHAASRG
jgi:hypothetical protein